MSGNKMQLAYSRREFALFETAADITYFLDCNVLPTPTSGGIAREKGHSWVNICNRSHSMLSVGKIINGKKEKKRLYLR